MYGSILIKNWKQAKDLYLKEGAIIYMPKRIKTTYATRVYGSIGQPAVASTVERHAHKKAGTKTGLNRKGIAATRKKGRSFPMRFKHKQFTSPAMRAVSTADLSIASARRAGLKTYGGKRVRKVFRGKKVIGKVLVREETRPRKELDLYEIIKDMPAVERLEERLGEEVALRRWLDGKLSTKIIDKPKMVADRIIKKRIALGKIVFELGGKNKLLRNVSHSWIVEAVFERLTGRKFNLTSPKGKMSRPTEGLTVYFTKKGKAILEYRKKRYDVTANLVKIAGKERIGKIVENAKKMKIAHT